MNLDPHQSLSDNLAANGFGHRPGNPNHGTRMVFRAETGEDIGAMTARVAWEWLNKEGADMISIAPRKGDIIHYRGEPVGTVTHTEGNLCWRTYPDGEALPFIWRFHDGRLNSLHSWPNKPA